MSDAKHITYRGTKSLGARVYALLYAGAKGGAEIRHVVRHSPDGLSWGYGGSGPADCALSILHDFCERTGRPVEVAERWYMAFKWDFVAVQGVELTIAGADIAEWLDAKEVTHEHAV